MNICVHICMCLCFRIQVFIYTFFVLLIHEVDPLTVFLANGSGKYTNSDTMNRDSGLFGGNPISQNRNNSDIYVSRLWLSNIGHLGVCMLGTCISNALEPYNYASCWWKCMAVLT